MSFLHYVELLLLQVDLILSVSLPFISYSAACFDSFSNLFACSVLPLLSSVRCLWNMNQYGTTQDTAFALISCQACIHTYTRVHTPACLQDHIGILFNLPFELRHCDLAQPPMLKLQFVDHVWMWMWRWILFPLNL